MDISSLKPSDRMIEIVHPSTEEKLGIRVTIMALSDDRLKKIKRKFLDNRLKLEAKGKNFKADEIEENRDTLAFEAILGWEWYGKDEDGKPVSFQGGVPAFTKANVLAVFEELPWFRNQIEEAIGDDKAFFIS